LISHRNLHVLNKEDLFRRTESSSHSRHRGRTRYDPYRYENIRANILYARLDPKGRGRIQISAELPLIYATGRRSELPEVRFPADAAAGADDAKPGRERASKLEPEPFLCSLPVYRYRLVTSLISRA
jgi:hypothetical protein